MLEEILRACTAQSYKTDTAGIVSGLTEGIAFRADLPAGTLQLSVNVPPEKLPRLHKQLASRYADIQLSPNEGYGILLTLPGMADMDGNAFIAFLQEAAQRSLGELHGAFDDHFEKDRESFSHYLTGLLGALLGAVVGVLPWFIAAALLNWQFGWLAFLVSTGSFFGYQYLRGAHSTSFATTCIVIASLLAMFASCLLNSAIGLMTVNPAMTLLEAMRYYLGSGIQALLRDMLFGIVFAAIGLVGIRSRVLSYTHESQWLRRGRKRK